MKEFWDERYKNESYVYGEEPNNFFKETLQKYNLGGNILLPAEGEGRNAVFAAKNELNVTCFDLSIQGKLKALSLAAKNNVSINYEVGEFSEMQFKDNYFNVIALIYAHFPAQLKSNYHQKLITYLKKGGMLILEGFSKEQLQINEANKQSFGPKNIEMLFSLEEIKNDFSSLKILQLSKELIQLNEGKFHEGVGSVIRFIGKKE